MKTKKHLLLFVLVIIVGVFCIACGNKETDKTTSTTESNQEKEDSQEPLEEETKTLSLNNTYTTKFGEINAITYPTFAFDYPDNWTISQEEVTQTSETVTLTNERGITIKFSHIGGVAEGQLGGGSGSYMRRVEVSKVADSNFVPGYVQATDYSSLGTFIVAELKVTGELDMQTDSDFTDVDGDISYAVIPESWIGTLDSVTGVFEGEFAFWYSDYISLIASSPDGEFSEAESQEVIEILSSFRNNDSIDNNNSQQITLADYLDTNEKIIFYYLNLDNIFDYSQIGETTTIDGISDILVFENGKCAKLNATAEFNDYNYMTVQNLFNLSNEEIYKKELNWGNYILTGYTDNSGKSLEREELWIEVENGYSGYDYFYTPINFEIADNYYAGFCKIDERGMQAVVTQCEQGTTFIFDNKNDLLLNPTTDDIKNAFK